MGMEFMRKCLEEHGEKCREVVENGKIVHKKKDSYEIGRPFCLFCHKWCDVYAYQNQAISSCCWGPFRLTQMPLNYGERKEFKFIQKLTPLTDS